MTGYTTIEDRLVVVLRIHDDWDEENVSQGDFRIMDQGNTHVLILTPGVSPHLRASQQNSQRIYAVNMDFGVRVEGIEMEAWKNFKTLRDNLFQHLESYPTLNDLATVHQVRIAAEGDPLGVPIDADSIESGLSHIWQEIQVLVNVNYTVTGGEYA